ncbi:MAG TPA: 4'-phosphopantetheinyl transferase superfamily protein [Steroidobacteraceae bacterium]|nr:4'-phosphopantetheinyl transferase superfamily protein [Steroidobacteraceae bacterium]
MNRVQRAVTVEKLFPPGAVAFETRSRGSASDLLPTERECVARSMDKRVSEFAAGRLCAHAAFAALGIEPTPLLMGMDRAPIWPAAVVGSITHSEGYCTAVAGCEAQFAAIGVDAECSKEMSASLWHLVMREEELQRLQNLKEDAGERMALLIFLAKEAFYKCQYELTRTWLGFEDVVIDVADDAFEVSVVDASHPIRRMRGPWIGRFSVGEDVVVAGIAAKRCR